MQDIQRDYQLKECERVKKIIETRESNQKRLDSIETDKLLESFEE